MQVNTAASLPLLELEVKFATTLITVLSAKFKIGGVDESSGKYNLGESGARRIFPQASDA